jgi:hypothetical protein
MPRSAAPAIPGAGRVCERNGGQIHWSHLDPAQNRRRYASRPSNSASGASTASSLPRRSSWPRSTTRSRSGRRVCKRPYQVTHATFVAGQLSPAIWPEVSFAVAGHDLTTERHGLPFSSSGSVTLLLWIYRSTVFSREPLDTADWAGLARPAETTRVLAPVLGQRRGGRHSASRTGCYANAMESAVSTMGAEVVASP